MTEDMPKSKGRLLVVDDDPPLRERLARAMTRKGLDVTTAEGVADAKNKAQQNPDYAVIDLRLGDGQGLEIVEYMRKLAPDCRMIILTGYGNIATAVAAVKAGAVDYLPKPADADAVEAALLGHKPALSAQAVAEKPMTPERLRWEHIQRIYEQCGRNISETARQLGMHRRTLQRIMNKYAPREQGEIDAADLFDSND